MPKKPDASKKAAPQKTKRSSSPAPKLRAPPPLPAWTTGDPARDAEFSIFRSGPGVGGRLPVSAQDLPFLLQLLQQPAMLDTGDVPPWDESFVGPEGEARVPQGARGR
ncbi:MAG: hypothetical protein JST54_11480 [Deltaproteobacteria bacterium]|nr:hypothetical protein [Deltaproteobacteria bacterium]